jgi:outer membrane protein assembly factor BamB
MRRPARDIQSVLFFVPGFALVVTGLSSMVLADGEVRSVDQIWRMAEKAYTSEHFERGHDHLKTLMDENPGDSDLAIKCLKRILREVGRHNPVFSPANHRLSVRLKSEDRWAVYAARRLCALERIRAISANTDTVREAVAIMVRTHERQKRLLDAVEMIDRFVKENPHDPFWRISLARFYRRRDSSKSRPLYDRLLAEMDLDHPDPIARQRWNDFFEEREADRRELPMAILPLPTGSLLLMMEPDDPDGEWGSVFNRAARDVPMVIDRLAARTLIPNQHVIWRDMSGVTDPSRALDQHLLSRPKADLERLRKLQAGRLAREEISAKPTDAEVLALFRRYRWAEPAQQRLLLLANKMLWSNRARSALRSFQDLLDHAVAADIRDAAQVGYWTARSQIGTVDDLDEMLDGVDPNRKLPWFGKRTKASTICKQLLANQSPSRPSVDPALKDLIPRIVHIPPVSPWSTGLPSTVDINVVGDQLLVSGRDMLAMYDARNPTQPVWSNTQRQQVDGRKQYYPGYFRPLFDGHLLYTRWGISFEPHGIAAIDRSTGGAIWSNAMTPHDLNARPTPRIPLGDPVLSDGLLYYLQWNIESHTNSRSGRRLSLVCFDPRSRKRLWDSTIAIGGLANDITASLERTRPETTIFGNRVTLHRGSVYGSSNSGMAVRSDVRDGRTDWIHHYRSIGGHTNVMNHGSPPIIAGDNVIFMPKDASHIFALDQRTGRLVWENPLVLGVQIVGQHDDLLIVRGPSAISGLELATGEIRWHRPLAKLVLGRAQLIGSSIYLAQLDELLRVNAKTGQIAEKRSWALKDERPRSFMISGRDLFVVTNKPGEDPSREIGRPLNPSLPNKPAPLALPLARAWSLSRRNAKIATPPKNSGLSGKAYIVSDGVIECVDASARGSILWQRFIDVRDPSIHFSGNTILAMDHAQHRLPGELNRVVAHDATDGRFLWESILPNTVHETINCGATQVFYNSNNRIIALEVTTGRKVWSRSWSRGHQMRLFWDAQRLHVLLLSRARTPHHLMLEPKLGKTLSRSNVDCQVAGNNVANGKRLKDGYYEVQFAAVRARYVRLVALSEVGGRGWTSIADLRVIGNGGKNLARDQWKVHHVDSSEVGRGRDARPEKAIDDDLSSWWHTQWIGAIPPHPHDFQIDMGSPQPVAGLRYLPAVILNNNGMIQDYEFYVSNDGKNWGKAVARGALVNRPRLDRAYATSNGFLFEGYDRGKKAHCVYRYPLDGKPARLAEENSRVVYNKGAYFLTTTRRANRDVLVVHRVDNPSYRFELGTTHQVNPRTIDIVGDRLISAFQTVVVADLAKKRFIVGPNEKKLNYDQVGLALCAESDNLLKIVPQGRKIYRFDLRTGRRTEASFPDQFELLGNRHHRHQQVQIQHFDRVVLLSDSSTVTALVADAGLNN